MWFANPATGAQEWGLGLGTVILTINVVLLGGYTLGCHSLRHLVGGQEERPQRHLVPRAFLVGDPPDRRRAAGFVRRRPHPERAALQPHFAQLRGKGYVGRGL